MELLWRSATCQLEWNLTQYFFSLKCTPYLIIMVLNMKAPFLSNEGKNKERS